ncbi:MAG: hypothetical protein IPK64_13640 [bacterium]|nr:hypothetical protein [bacterium]
MSKKKRTRPNDQPIEGFADLEDEFTGAGTGDQSEAVAAPSPGGAGPVGTPPHAATLRPAAVRRSPAAPPPWGTVFAASVILAGVGLGAAALLAGRSGSPAWAPTDLLDPAKYAAPLRNPLNLVAMLSVLVGIVAAVGARALNAAMRASTADRAAAERLLEKLTALRLDNEGPWGDPALRDHPNAGTFTAEVLGAWRLQGARLRRLNGVEGELHRVEKALSENAREVLTGRFDSPAVGALADELVRFLDARNADARELAELRQRNDDESGAAMALIQEARAWNRTTLEQIGTQGSALERMSRRLEDIGTATSAGGANAGQAPALLAEIRRELAGHSAARVPRGTGLEDLAAQGSKLAFQIAMEVARLGTRGERLQPMSQALEELTTSLRQALDTNAGPTPANLGATLAKVDALSQQIGQAGGGLTPEALEEIGRSGPVIGRVAANLADVGRRFQVQSERLVRLGESFSALTGAPFDASLSTVTTAAEPAAEAPLRVIPQDPFCREGGAARAEVDPFVVEAPLVAPAPRPLLTTEPVAPPQPVFVPEPEDDGFVIERAEPDGGVFDHGAIEVAPLELETVVPGRVEDSEPAAPPVARSEERIYELAEFGAVRLDDQTVAGQVEEEQVHELAEFGAVRVA